MHQHNGILPMIRWASETKPKQSRRSAEVQGPCHAFVRCRKPESFRDSFPLLTELAAPAESVVSVTISDRESCWPCSGS